MDSQQKRLQTLLDQLTVEHRANLLDFAEHLLSCQPSPEVPPESEVVVIPRPDNESVVSAIRRLSHSYPMLDRDRLLNEASSLMARHVLQGITVDATIDQLENLFCHRYQALQPDSSQEGG